MANNTVLKLQALSKSIKQNNAFQIFIVFIILISSLTIGIRTYNINPIIANVVNWTDNLITLFFLFELIIRIVAERRWYHFFHYKNFWNWFDFLIVVGSLIPIEQNNDILLGRLLRLFRVMRLISFIPQLRILVSALMVALPRMGYVAMMMFVIFYIYATLGSLLFAQINSDLWQNVGHALLTLFRVATLEDWTDVMYETMTVYPLSWIYYVSFIFLSAFVFLNMMIGIIINVLEEEHDKLGTKNREQEQSKQTQTLQRIEKQTQQLQQQLRHLNKQFTELKKRSGNK